MNRSIGELARLLDDAEAVVLTTHSGPDGDGLGCLVALREALEARGKRVLALLPDPLGSRYRFLDPEQRMVVVDDAQEDRSSYDLALVLDTHDRQLLRGVDPWISDRKLPLYFLDHHPIAEGWTLDKVRAMTEEAVSYAVQNGIPVMYVTEDTTRTDPDSIRALFQSAIRAGAFTNPNATPCWLAWPWRGQAERRLEDSHVRSAR